MPKPELDPDHAPDPHYQATGEWVCYLCKRPLIGSALRPVIPWLHRPKPAPAKDATKIEGLNTTE